MMDFKSLALFQHLAQSQHFGQTANAMFVSPSTLTRVVQRLEEELGVPLLKRNNRSVKLTDAGEKLQAFASDVLTQWQNLQAVYHQQQSLLAGELKIFCSVTASQSHLPQILNLYKDKHPQVDIKLITGDPNSGLERLYSQQADIVIGIHTPDFPDDCYFQLIDEVPMQLIMAKQHRIRHIDQVNWAKRPVILPDMGASKGIINEWFARHEVKPNIYATVGGHEAILSMVALDMGIGFVPEIVVRYSALKDAVNVLDVHDMRRFQLGLCCLERHKNDAKICAMLAI